jgi:hypothetical protein
LAITLDEAQRLENAAPLRLKFAGESNLDDYAPFFESLPKEGWTPTQLGFIETRTESASEAWKLSDGQFEIVAVEHESGIELILVPILVGVAAPLLTDAIKGFLKWAWKRWHDVRKQRSASPSTLIIEIPRADSSAPPLRLLLSPPVSDNEIARCLQVAEQLRAAA